jgi:hypothetical protein
VAQYFRTSAQPLEHLHPHPLFHEINLSVTKSSYSIFLHTTLVALNPEFMKGGSVVQIFHKVLTIFDHNTTRMIEKRDGKRNDAIVLRRKLGPIWLLKEISLKSPVLMCTCESAFQTRRDPADCCRPHRQSRLVEFDRISL